MVSTLRKAGLLVLAVLVLAGCATVASGPIAMPTPARGDTEGQIMSVTGAGFTICGASSDADFDLPSPSTSNRYDIVVCGSVDKARHALQAAYPDLVASFDLRSYRPDDDGPHSPQDMVMQFWIMHTTGPEFTVVSSQIVGDGMVDVGISGDLKAAQAVLDKEFPAHTKVHSQASGVNLVGPKASPPPS